MAMFAVAAILPSLAVNPVATLSTSLGDIKVELFLDRVPRTASNFIDLAQSGEACHHPSPPSQPTTATEHSRPRALATRAGLSPPYPLTVPSHRTLSPYRTTIRTTILG